MSTTDTSNPSFIFLETAKYGELNFTYSGRVISTGRADLRAEYFLRQGLRRTMTELSLTEEEQKVVTTHLAAEMEGLRVVGRGETKAMKQAVARSKIATLSVFAVVKSTFPDMTVEETLKVTPTMALGSGIRGPELKALWDYVDLKQEEEQASRASTA